MEEQIVCHLKGSQTFVNDFSSVLLCRYVVKMSTDGIPGLHGL